MIPTEHPTLEPPRKRRFLPTLQDIAFFAFFMVIALAGIDSRLIYHGQSVGFSTIPGFVGRVLAYPAGPCDYLNRLMSQTYNIQWLGAMVLTAQAILVAFVTHAYFRALAGRSVPLVRFVPAVLLMMYESFYHETLAIVLWLVVGVGAAIFFERIARRLRNQLARLAIFAIMLGAVFYVAGPGIIFFATCAAVIQIARRPRVPVGIIYILLAAGLPLAVEKWLFPYQPLIKGWLVHQTQAVDVIAALIYLLYPLGSLIVVMRNRLAIAGQWAMKRLPRLQAALAPARGPRQPRPGEKQLSAVLGLTFLLLGAGALAGLARHISAPVRRSLTMDYLCLHEDWPGVIEHARDMPLEEYNPVTCYQVNLALHMAGRMGDEMFSFPQRGVVMLNLRVEGSPPYMLLLSDMCLRLGRVGDAEHFICETYTMVGDEPRVLDLMARIYLVKGQAAAARKMLTVLSYDLTYGDTARRRLRQLDQDPQLSGDEEIQLYRRRMLRNDDLAAVSKGNFSPINIEQLLLDQLQQDPTNRMAFEFLMATYLELSELGRAADLMPGIKNITGPGYVTADGSRRTPVAYQEAMAALADRDGGPPAIEGFKIDPDTTRRMSEMKQIAAKLPDPQTRFQAMWDNYRHSYFYFLLFGAGDYR